MSGTHPTLSWRWITAQVTGATHRRRQQPCQDALICEAFEHGLVLVLADGHGSARSPKSDVGSRLAVEIGRAQLRHFALETLNQSLSAIKDWAVQTLPRKIVQAWSETIRTIESGRASDPGLLVEYGSTVLAVLITERYLLYLQLGDGDLLAVDATGAVSRPIPLNPLLFANDTTSLCQPNAWNNMTVIVQPMLQPEAGPSLLLLATDGYANAFASNTSFEQVGSDLVGMVAQADGWAQIEQHLPDWIEEATTQGSGDDISIGLLWNTATRPEARKDDLSPNQVLKAYNSQTTWHVKQLLGSGGQGEVYKVSDGTRELALKWYYHDQASDAQLDTLKYLVRTGPPSDRFLWPLDLVSTGKNPDYGYLMPLREPRFKGIVDLMKRRAEPTFRALCTACFELAHHYMLLHSKGLAYRDISFGNVFFDPKIGEVRICDNDNVTANQQAGGVAGTPRFMAPEIVRGEANPSTETDLFSLSVLLFYMLLLHHPLEGAREAAIRCLDLPAMNKLYGSEPLFIFDPQDTSNQPVAGYQDNPLIYWSIYPQFIRDLFTRAFTEGLHADKRVRENEWRKAMVKLRDSIIYGPSGAENFYDPLKLQSGQPHLDWATKQPINLPPRLKIGDLVVLLNADTTLAPHHLDGKSSYDFSRVLGRVNRHPSDPNIWGLKNESDLTWNYTTAEGQVQTVEPGRNITLKPDLVINFGPTQGEVRV